MGRPRGFNQDAAVEIALDAFWRDGFEACSVKALSERLGITRSSFYNAFESREALFDLALQAYRERSPDRTLQREPPDAPARQVLTRGFREICRALADETTPSGCLVANTIAELGGTAHPVAAALRELMLGRVKWVERLLERGVARGELPGDMEAAGVALAVVNTMLGLNIMAKASADEGRLWLSARTMLQGLGLYDPDAL